MDPTKSASSSSTPRRASGIPRSGIPNPTTTAIPSFASSSGISTSISATNIKRPSVVNDSTKITPATVAPSTVTPQLDQSRLPKLNQPLQQSSSDNKLNALTKPGVQQVTSKTTEVFFIQFKTLKPHIDIRNACCFF